jgi:hypothetical protein
VVVAVEEDHQVEMVVLEVVVVEMVVIVSKVHQQVVQEHQDKDMTVVLVNKHVRVVAVVLVA